MILMSLFLFLVVNKYFLVVLIMIELVISNLAILMFWSLRPGGRGGIFLYYLVFRVCERVIGLGILVLVIRYYGRDHYKVTRRGKD